MSEFDQVLSTHSVLHDLTLRMLELARAEKWDDVLDILPAHRLAQQQAQDSSAQAIDNANLESLSRLLRETDDANQELIARLSGWQAEVGAILEEIRLTQVNGRRLGKTYGAG
ncbi:hypothetical protein [Chitinimonas sp. BJYL2]|uniref:hypothetical protein n=1 Tax=Chitinimonas sp. BJYL2 TaxID=2976696 RepID=UPI0022B481E5|nr:hypothetical protein [Chitinimonas sp. BJYL2]